jgi:hypothetical protein
LNAWAWCGPNVLTAVSRHLLKGPEGTSAVAFLV